MLDLLCDCWIISNLCQGTQINLQLSVSDPELVSIHDGYLCVTSRLNNNKSTFTITVQRVRSHLSAHNYVGSPVWICLTKLWLKKYSRANVLKSTAVQLICRFISITSTVWIKWGDEPLKKLCVQKYPQFDTVGVFPQVWVNVKSKYFVYSVSLRAVVQPKLLSAGLSVSHLKYLVTHLR